MNAKIGKNITSLSFSSFDFAKAKLSSVASPSRLRILVIKREATLKALSDSMLEAGILRIAFWSILSLAVSSPVLLANPISCSMCWKLATAGWTGAAPIPMTTFQPSFHSFRPICLFPTEFCSDLFRKDIFPSIPANLHISEGIPYRKIPFRPRN